MTRQDIKIFIILFYSVTNLNFSQTINDISIINNKQFNDDQYLQWISINKGSQLFEGIEDTIKTKLIRALSDNGFLNNLIRSIDINYNNDSLSATISIDIEEGTATYLKSVRFIGLDSAETETIKIFFENNTENIFNKYELEGSITEALEYYENIGYPFASVKIESIYFEFDEENEERNAHVILNINRGLESKIDEIKIVGNDKTSRKVILRNIGINKGDNYIQSKISNIPSALNKLRFFENISQPSFYFNSKDKGILEITVKEKSTNNFDGILGYVPGSEQEKGYFTGFINISLRNLFGTGRAFAFTWKRETSLTQELDIKYFEPWILDYPFNIKGEFFQRKQDTTYVKRFIAGELEFIATENLSASFLIETENIIPSLGENIFKVYNSSKFTTGIQFLFDSRNDFYNPTDGFMLLNNYRFSQKKINGPAEFIPQDFDTKISLQKFELDFHYLQKVFSKQIISVELHARELKGDFLEASDLYQFGGTNTLRGYVEKQFSGNRLLWTNLEYRYILSQRSFAFAFYDYGYYLRSQQGIVPESSDQKYGYGFGLNIETAMGVMNISYALGDEDTFSTGKIHFGLINEF